MLLEFHTATGYAALAAGAWNLLTTKGTRRHRAIGAIYVASMTLLLVTSLFIFELFAGFGPFHAMTILSGVSLAIAIYFPLRRHRHPNWVGHHYYWIGYSYIGLVMATGSHLFALLPGWPFWARAALLWGLPYVIGSLLLFAMASRMMARYADRAAERA